MYSKQLINEKEKKKQYVTLNDDFTVKIVDLGFSRHLEEGVASTVCGTPITMARISWLQDSRAKQRATITKLIFGPWVRLPMNCLLDEFPSMRVVIICIGGNI